MVLGEVGEFVDDYASLKGRGGVIRDEIQWRSINYLQYFSVRLVLKIFSNMYSTIPLSPVAAKFFNSR